MVSPSNSRSRLRGRDTKQSLHADGDSGFYPYITREQVDEDKKDTGFKSKAFQASALYRLITIGAVLFNGMLISPPNFNTTAIKYAMIHNNFGPAEDGAMDKKRWSLELDVQTAPWLWDVEERVRSVLRKFNLLSASNHVFEGMTLLKTEEGTRNQVWHTDYKGGGIFRYSRPSKGLYDRHPCTPWAISVLIATEETGARLAFPKGELNLKFGDAVVFAGDLVHAGCRYNEDNFRLHIYYGFDAGPNKKKVVQYDTTADERRVRKVFICSPAI